MKRFLSFRQAQACENAEHPTCRCRCGGVLHGANRIARLAPREVYTSLQPEDPHNPLTKRERVKGGLIEVDLMNRRTSQRMYARLRRRKNPGRVILHAVEKRLVEMWRAAPHGSADREELSTALATCKLCMSRVMSDLVV